MVRESRHDIALSERGSTRRRLQTATEVLAEPDIPGMSYRRALPSLLISLLAVAALPAHGDNDVPARARPAADTPRAKAQEAERQRLVAKLRAEAPKVDDLPAPSHPLAAPIFHRYEPR